MPVKYEFVPYAPARMRAAEQEVAVREFLEMVRTRRSVREFSAEDVPQGLVDHAIAAAATAPSGANQQPWRFVVVRDAELKRRIRVAAEEEERQNYEERFPAEWLEALEPLGTDWHKGFLEVAPLLIVVFRIDYGLEGERKIKHYYVNESVGIACGFLLAALHAAGLATLTHTPSPMKFLATILGRPANERPFLLIPVGYPAGEARVPVLVKKSLDEVRIVR